MSTDFCKISPTLRPTTILSAFSSIPESTYKKNIPAFTAAASAILDCSLPESSNSSNSFSELLAPGLYLCVLFQLSSLSSNLADGSSPKLTVGPVKIDTCRGDPYCPQVFFPNSAQYRLSLGLWSKSHPATLEMSNSPVTIFRSPLVVFQIFFE